MTRKVASRSDGGGDTYIVDSVELRTIMDWKNLLESAGDKAKITIVTYSFYGVDLIKDMKNVTLIMNSKRFDSKFNESLPMAKIQHFDNTHAKIVLIEPNIVCLSSQNFGPSCWFEGSLVVRDDPAIYQHYFEHIKNIDKNRTGNIKRGSFSDGSKHYGKVAGNPKPYAPNIGSLSLSDVEIKFSTMVNWNQKFNGCRDRDIIVCTYTLPNLDYVRTILGKLFKQGNRVRIVANKICEPVLSRLACEFDELKISIKPNMHAKMILIDSNLVWLSSQNFGTSGWLENTVRIKSDKAYQFYKDRLDEYLLE